MEQEPLEIILYSHYKYILYNKRSELILSLHKEQGFGQISHCFSLGLIETKKIDIIEEEVKGFYNEFQNNHLTLISKYQKVELGSIGVLKAREKWDKKTRLD